MMFSNSFSIGASSLRAMQKQVDIHSANIANVNTPGYRRRDVYTQTEFGGGVSNVVMHRFNPATAQRLSQLSGETGYFDAKSSALNHASDVVSQAATDVGAAQNKLNELLYRASLTPSEPGLRQQIASAAGALASVANSGISSLETQITHLSRDVKTTKGLAEQKMDELASLNQEAFRTGPTPALRDRQAQVGRELSELVGGEVRMEKDGTATFMLNNAPLVYSDTKRALPDTTGGKLAGLKDAQTATIGYRDELTAQLEGYATQMNALNATGVDANGAAGQPLFAMSMGQLQYTGDSAGNAFAVQGSGPGVPSPTQAMANMTTLAEGYLDTVVKSAADSSAAATTSSSKDATLAMLDEEQQAKEGVDLDSEMIALKLAQRIYEASAKVIQTADSMMGTLLNMKA